MDEYLENCSGQNYDEEGQLFQEQDQFQDENFIEPQPNQLVGDEHEQQPIDYEMNQNASFNQGDGNLMDVSANKVPQNDQDNKSTEKLNKQKQFQDEMVSITAKNFRNNFAQSGEMKPEMNYEDINSIKEAIKMQMEYYFSDSNLIHDKYLRSIIEKSPNQCVDIKLFLKFKRIQHILDAVEKGRVIIFDSTNNHNVTTDNKKGSASNNNNNHQNQQQSSKKHLILLIRDCLFNSIILKVKKDSTKVKRSFPFNYKLAQNNSNQRTIYIDYLPHKCTKQILVAIFDTYNITNINLPLQKNSEMCKGFGFIEFATHEEANHAQQTKNSSIPKELVQLTDKKLGQGSIRLITLQKWEEEKKTFKNLTTTSQSEKQHSSKQDGQKRKESYEFNEADINLVHGTLIKITNIPDNTLKTEIVLAVRHLGFEFYCDYLSNDQNEVNQQQKEQARVIDEQNYMQSEINNEDESQDDKAPHLSNILKQGQAMIRFQKEKDREDALKKLAQLSKTLAFEIKSKSCQVVMVDANEEAQYWEYVKYKKNQFRKFFFLKKLEKKQKLNSNKN